MQNNSVTGASFIDIPGVRIAYEMAGQGSPLILLHGSLLDRRMWDGQLHSSPESIVWSVTICEVPGRAKRNRRPSCLLIMKIFVSF